MSEKTYLVIGPEGKIYSAGQSREAAIRNLDEILSPADFEAESWEEVIAEADAREGVIGDGLQIFTQEEFENRTADAAMA